MTVIGTNVSALRTSYASNKAEMGLAQAMERLSTGRRINSAADDAAGLAVATRMTSDVRGMNAAIRNANDGISLVQTAEGGLNEITNMMQRMRELAVQAATGTLSSGDRGNLNEEVKALQSQISDVAKRTTFNGVNLLNNGTVRRLKFKPVPMPMKQSMLMLSMLWPALWMFRQSVSIQWPMQQQH